MVTRAIVALLALVARKRPRETRRDLPQPARPLPAYSDRDRVYGLWVDRSGVHRRPGRGVV